MIQVPLYICGSPHGSRRERGISCEVRVRAKREQLETFQGLSPERQGQNLVLAESGLGSTVRRGESAGGTEGNHRGKRERERARKITEENQASTDANAGGESERETTEEIIQENQGGKNERKIKRKIVIFFSFFLSFWGIWAYAAG